MKTNPTPALTSAELLKELQSLVAEAKELIGGAVSERTAGAVGAMRARFENAQERLGKLYAGAQGKVVAGAESTDKVIRANPYQSLAIAAAAGLLLGVLLGRRCK